MKTKSQIARQMYGASLDNLSASQKGAVTKRFNEQAPDMPAAPVRQTYVEPVRAPAGYATVKFGRPGVNGLKECAVAANTTVKQALDQSGVGINEKKEGILVKATGATAKFNDVVRDGATYLICPGVDSSRQ